MNPNLLYQSVNKLIAKGATPRYRLDLTFVTAKGNCTAMSVVEKWSSSDFAGSSSPDMTVRVMLTVKDYRDYVYLYRDNLNVILQKTPIDPISNQPTQGKRFVTAYRAFLIENEDASITRGTPLTSGTYSDGKDDMRFFNIQLVDPVAEYISAKSGGGIFRFSGGEDVIKAFIWSAAKAEVGSERVKLKGLEVSPVDEKSARDSTFIPHSVTLRDFPAYLQNFEGGVYYDALGSFVKEGVWYIYPVFKTSQFSQSKRKIVLFQVPTNMVPISDTTYTDDGTTLTIVCSGAAKIEDFSVGAGVSVGNGTRFVRATNFMENPIAMRGDNTGEINRSEVMAEFKSVAHPDGLNIAKFSNTLVTDNIANERSKNSGRNGQIMVTTWQNSNGDLIHPGMPIRVYHDIGGKISIKEGVVLQVDEQWALERPGLTSKVMTSAAGLVLFLAKDPVDNS